MDSSSFGRALESAEGAGKANMQTAKTDGIADTRIECFMIWYPFIYFALSFMLMLMTRRRRNVLPSNGSIQRGRPETMIVIEALVGRPPMHRTLSAPTAPVWTPVETAVSP